MLKKVCFFFVNWWGHSCYLIDDIHRDVRTSLLPFYSQDVDHRCRSVDLVSFSNGKITFDSSLYWSSNTLQSFSLMYLRSLI